MRLRWLAGVVVMCVVVLGLGATSAFANTSVTINGGTLEVTGGDDGGFPVATPDANAITVSHDRLLQQFTVSDVNQVDAVQNSTGTVPCQQTSMTTVTCPDGAVTGIAVDTNGGNDSATIAPDAGNPLYPASLAGGSGDDTLNGGSADDALNGGAGTDTLNGNGGDDTFAQGSANDGADTMDGGSGTDTVDYSSRSNDLAVTTDDAAANDGEKLIALPPTPAEGDNVASNVENVLGGSGNDSLTGADSVSNTINGGDGNDDLAGGADSNGSAADTLIGGAGNDTLDSGAGDDSLQGDAGNDTLTAYAGLDRLSGGDGTDTENGGADNDTFGEGTAANGADTFIGGDGTNDAVDYSGRTAPLTITFDNKPNDGDGAQTENDNITPDVERVEGGAAGDTITGGAGVQKLNGNGGNDKINAREDTNPAADVVTCGAGTDEATLDALDLGVLPAGHSCENIPTAGGGTTQTPPPSGGGAPPQFTIQQPPSSGASTSAGAKAGPVVTLSVVIGELRSVAARGLRGTIGCSEACAAVQTFTVDARTRTKLRLSSPVIAQRVFIFSASGKKVVLVRFNPKARKRLVRLKSVRVTVSLVAADRAGNSGSMVRKTVTLRR